MNPQGWPAEVQLCACTTFVEARVAENSNSARVPVERKIE
jgi:hypothetical protein